MEKTDKNNPCDDFHDLTKEETEKLIGNVTVEALRAEEFTEGLNIMKWITPGIFNLLCKIHSPLKDNFARRMASLLVNVPAQLFSEKIHIAPLVEILDDCRDVTKGIFSIAPYKNNSIMILENRIIGMIGKENVQKLFGDFLSDVRFSWKNCTQGKYPASEILNFLPEDMAISVNYRAEAGEERGVMLIIYSCTSDITGTGRK